MPLARFDTPGRLRDASAASSFYDEWDGLVRGLFGPDNLGAPDIDDPSPRLGGFFNPTTTDVPVIANRDLIWMEFPEVSWSRIIHRDGGRRSPPETRATVPAGPPVVRPRKSNISTGLGHPHGRRLLLYAAHRRHRRRAGLAMNARVYCSFGGRCQPASLIPRDSKKRQSSGQPKGIIWATSRRQRWAVSPVGRERLE